MTEKKGTNSVSVITEGEVLVMERIFNAPRELIFKAFSESVQLSNWWGPKGWRTENRTFEFKPNGIWHYCMRCTDENQGEFYGQLSWGKAVYHDIIVPEKIVYTDMFADKDGNAVNGMPEILVTMIFNELEGKTKLTIRSQFASIETLQQVMDMGVVQGFSSQLDRLDDLLQNKA